MKTLLLLALLAVATPAPQRTPEVACNATATPPFVASLAHGKPQPDHLVIDVWPLTGSVTAGANNPFPNGTPVTITITVRCTLWTPTPTPSATP